MNTRVAGGVRAVEVAPQRKEIKFRYMEALTLIERLHRRLLDVIKDDFKHSGEPEVNPVRRCFCSTSAMPN
jgi:hypothetical protein